MMVDSHSEEKVLVDAVQDIEPTAPQNRILHRTIELVTRDLESMSFNTVIARLMEFVNFFTKESVRPKSVMEKFTLMLSPLAPHLAEELWAVLGHNESLAYQRWPIFDPELIKESEVEVPIQLNGKIKTKLMVPADCDAAGLEKFVRDNSQVQELLAGKQIVKAIVVPGRLVNFVVK